MNAPAVLGGSDRPLAEAFDVGLLDLDGVVYRGGASVPAAADAIEAARAAGMRVAFTTNNASRTVASVVARLAQAGVRAAEDDVVTSAQAALTLLAERLPGGAPVLVLGSDELAEQVRAAGWALRTTAEPDVAAVVQGYGPEVGYSQLVEASLAIRAGALWIAGNTDATMPSERGLLPGNGALVAALRTATDREPVVAGKPGPALHAEAVRRTGARDPLVVGDRLDTDVLGAVRAGSPSLLVLTGVTSVADLLAAPVDQRPTFVAHDLRGLLRAHQPTQPVQDGVCCGAAVARGGAGGVTLTGDDPDERLAALAGLVWSGGGVAADDGPDLVRAALVGWDGATGR